MTETRKSLVPVQVDMLCDGCGHGKMRPTGICLTSNPPQFPHVCDSCGRQEIYLKNYPHIDYELAPTSSLAT